MVTREGGVIKDIKVTGQEGVKESVANDIALIFTEIVVAVLVTYEYGVAGGISKLEYQRVAAFGAVAEAFPLHAGEGAASGLVVETEVQGVTHTHLTVEGEVVVEAYRERRELVGFESCSVSMGIDIAVLVEGIERGHPESGRLDGKRAVDEGVTVLPQGGIGIACIVGEVVHKRKMEPVGAGGLRRRVFGGLTGDSLIHTESCQHFLCISSSEKEGE